MDFEFTAIGVIRSCYREKFGIPRQPGLVRSTTAILELLPPFNTGESLRGLDEFSHVWILFLFHRNARNEWKATVRPPRLGGNERVGVFASRSSFRPNPIGLSVVKLLRVKDACLELGGGDFLDGTPVLDIKPYIPYADSLPAAQGAFANMAPAPTNTVSFAPDPEACIPKLESEHRPALRQIIVDMLAYDPRPAYQDDDPNRVYGTRLYDLEVRWKQAGTKVTVVEIKRET